MPVTKLKSITFDLPPFRKLGSLTIPFAERITLVAGHNGIGKSTILGLSAHCSGLRNAAYKSYFSRAFVANLNEIIHLDYQKEFEDYKTSGTTFPSPVVEYLIDGLTLLKRCSITQRTDKKEVRVVPRNDPHTDFLNAVGDELVGKDAKVSLPTLYLGMTRMLPVGESDPNWVTNSIDSDIHVEDALFIQDFISNVMGSHLQNSVDNSITTQSIKGTRKTAKHPSYSYSAKCISLGQDSLSAIATALASFQKLKREWPEYPGGLLVIDEVDAGFHPHAQRKLALALCKSAKKLNLQILATTHSVSLIEAIHPDSNPLGPGGKRIDSVVYLTDTTKPRVAEGYSLADIQQDMSLIPPPRVMAMRQQSLKVYLEDFEAGFFLKALLTAKLKRRIKVEAGVRLKVIPLSAGCENLQRFQKYDAHFSTVLIVLDADASISGTKKATRNILKLPGGKTAQGSGLSPERTLHSFIEKLANMSGTYPIARSALTKKKITSDYLRSHLLEGNSNMSNRVSAKKWMSDCLKHIEDWEIVQLWTKEHPVEVANFEDQIVAAAKAISMQG